MEQAQEKNRERVFKEIAADPRSAFHYINTQHTALKLCYETLHDLSWGKGGSIDPTFEEYTRDLIHLVGRIIRDEV